MKKTNKANTVTTPQAQAIETASAAITRKALKTLWARKNAKAEEILTTYQHPLIEDLQQQVALTIIENIADIEFLTVNTENVKGKKTTQIKLNFTTPESKKAVFKTVQNTLYSMEQKHLRHLWIHNDNTINQRGEIVDESQALDIIMYTQAVRAYTMSINDIEVKALIKEFSATLTDKQLEVFMLLLQDMTMQQIATRLNIAIPSVQDRINSIRRKLTSQLQSELPLSDKIAKSYATSKIK